MYKQTIKRAVVGAIFGAVLLGAIFPSSAAPVSSSTTAFRQATPSDVTDVRYRRYYGRRYYNPGAAIGLGILGAAVGAATIGSGYGYYGPGYGYYGEPGYYTPGYYGNPYPYRRRYYYGY